MNACNQVRLLCRSGWPQVSRVGLGLGFGRISNSVQLPTFLQHYGMVSRSLDFMAAQTGHVTVFACIASFLACLCCLGSLTVSSCCISSNTLSCLLDRSLVFLIDSNCVLAILLYSRESYDLPQHALSMQAASLSHTICLRGCGLGMHPRCFFARM